MREISGQVFIQRLQNGEDLPTGPNDPPLRVIGAVDLRAQVIKSSRVAYAVHFLGAVDFREATIKGTLDLTACIFEDPVLFENAAIEGSLILSGLSAPMVNLHGIEVSGDLDLGRAHLYQAVEISDGIIRGYLDLSGVSTESVRLHHSTIEGNFFLGRGKDKQVSKINEIDASGAKVFGNVEIAGIGISDEKRETEAGHVPAVKISLINARVHGSVILKSHANSPSRVGSFNLSGALIEGDVNLEDCYIESGLEIQNATINGNTSIRSMEAGDARINIGFVNFSRSRFRGYLYVTGALVRGYVSLTEVRIEGILIFETSASYRTEIDGEFVLSGLRSSSQVEFYGIRVTGPTTIIGAETATLIFNAGIRRAPNSAYNNGDSPRSNGKPVGEVFPFQTETLFIYQCQIKGTLSIPYLQVFGSTSKFGIRGLSIMDSHITGSLRLWRFGAFKNLEDRRGLSLPIKPWLFSSAIIGTFRIRRCKIGADCDLTFVKVSGVIDLSDTEIKGDLRVASTITSDVWEEDESDDLVDELRQISPLDMQVRATCKEFRMRMVRCESDVDLTGLTILADQNDLEGHGGGLDARYVQVRGDVQTYFLSGDSESQQKWESYAEIPGSLDLSHANLARLVVSAHSFPAPECEDPEHANAADEGIVFTRAKIGKLEIPRTHRRKWKYPIPLNLEDIAVEAWEIGEDEDEKYQAGRQFIALLENDRQFRRSTYRAIEQNLRNGGQDDQANAIYRSMKDREWREYRKSRQFGVGARATGNETLPESQKALKPVRYVGGTILHYGFFAPLHYSFKYLLQYGTNPERLLFVIMLLAVLSLPIYRNPANFEASLELLAPNVERFSPGSPGAFQPSYGASPPESIWGWDDAIAMMIRYHVPVASLVVRSDWQPRGDPGLSYGRRPIFKVPLLAPEDFTNLMQLLNLICWPLLITFWIRKLLRQ